MTSITVSNTTPLTYLAKLNKIDLIKNLYKKILIPQEVYQEIIKGKESGKNEVFLIENLINERFIQVKETEEIKKEIKSLHIGELKAINLCFQENIKDILIDDKEAYEICKLFKLNPIRTTALLLEFTKKNFIKKNEFKDLLIKLSKEGYFLSIEVFDYLVKEVEKIK